MIYTVTFNPSLDYNVSVEAFRLGYTNRTSMEKLVCGGKGINVSIVLHNLGMENTALGFVAGFTGEEIVRQLEAAGVNTDFIRLESGLSRINMKLLNVDGTEINGCGPPIGEDKLEELRKQLEKLEKGDVLFLAGSVPSSLPSDIYQQIMIQLEGRGVCIVVDASKELLGRVLPHHPFLIKPNRQELEEFFGVRLQTEKEIITYGRRLKELGAQNVLISLGGDGGILLSADGRIMRKPAPCGTVISSVGAGDSMVAGFMAGWLTEGDYECALSMGVAAGSAAAFSEGLATKEAIANIKIK